MKRVSLLFSVVIPIFAIVALFNVFATPVQAIEVSGTITSDTTWTLANSPYVVTDSLNIQAGTTLTIEPGVEVHAGNNTSLYVNGHLVVGSEDISTTSIISGFSTLFFMTTGTGAINHAEITGIGMTGYGVAVLGESNNLISIRDSVIQNEEFPIWTYTNNLQRLQMENVSFVNNLNNRLLVNPDGVDNSLSDNVTLVPQPGLEGYEISSLDVPIGITLTLEAGATLLGKENASVHIYGHLNGQGDVSSSAVITGFNNIFFMASGTGDINHTEINGTNSFVVAVLGESNNPVSIKDSIIRSQEYPIWIDANSLHRLQMDNLSFAAATKNRIFVVPTLSNDSLSNDVILTPQPGLEGYEVNRNNNHDLHVPAGITLTLEAGATLMSEDNASSLYIDGHLVTTGSITSSSMITGFNTIFFMASGTSDINHTEINGMSSFVVVVLGESNNLVSIKDSIIRSQEYPVWIYPSSLHRLQMDNLSFAAATKNRIFVVPTLSDDSLSNDVILTPQPGLEGYEVDRNNNHDLHVPAGITLTMGDGVSLYVRDEQKIEVNGRFIANGTQVNPVTITSYNDSAPGEWGGISVNGGEVILNHTNLRNGEVNLTLTSPTSTVTISNSTVISASQSGISVTAGLLDMECSVLSDNGSAGLWVDSSGTPDVTINRTGIWSNGSAGITNTNSTFLDARYNWWGTSDGPGGDFSGSGDPAFGSILLSPWLNAPNDCAQPPFRLFLPMILALDD